MYLFGRHQGAEHKGVMRLLPNYFKTLGEGPARGMERGEKDSHEVYRTTQSTLTSQSTSTLSLCLSLSLSRSLSLSLSVSVALSLSHALALKLALSHCVCRSLTLSLSEACSLCNYRFLWSAEMGSTRHASTPLLATQPYLPSLARLMSK